MRLVIPLSRSDADRLPWLVDVMIHLQGLQAHEILLFSTPSVVNVANAQADRLRAVCPSVAVASMEIEPVWGWPTNPNIQWFSAVQFLHNSGHRAGWFWMEVDCVPVKTEWANLLANEYMSKGKPFCGRVVDTPFRDAQGNITPTPANDTMMMGCSVYPPGMMTDAEISPLMRDIGKAPPRHAEQPWDIYLRWVMKRRGVAHTDLIADMWNTGNYRMENGALTCDPAPHADEKLRGRAKGGAVAGEAILVHGCKDRSLYELVVSGGLNMPLKPVGYKLDAPSLADQIVPPTPIEAPTPPPTPAPTPVAVVADPDESLQSTPHDRVRKTLEEWNGSASLKRLSEATNISQDELRMIIPLIGYEVRGTAGWIGKAKAEVEV